MSDNDKSKVEADNINKTENIGNTNSGPQHNPMQTVQTKPLSTILQYSEDQAKKTERKDSGD
ncbi:hypothetical protein [Peptoclostridium acidaminophilum]|uniref:hypothetical protein n=1 Tax=Peptoclostridium acidaminophilum TaxID=1731 RepID=UPI00046CD021|nr:hypothetical protein [Peptoclostridium acidaminophilum]